MVSMVCFVVCLVVLVFGGFFCKEWGGGMVL